MSLRVLVLYPKPHPAYPESVTFAEDCRKAVERQEGIPLDAYGETPWQEGPRPEVVAIFVDNIISGEMHKVIFEAEALGIRLDYQWLNKSTLHYMNPATIFGCMASA